MLSVVGDVPVDSEILMMTLWISRFADSNNWTSPLCVALIHTINIHIWNTYSRVHMREIRLWKDPHSLKLVKPIFKTHHDSFESLNWVTSCILHGICKRTSNEPHAINTKTHHGVVRFDYLLSLSEIYMVQV